MVLLDIFGDMHNQQDFCNVGDELDMVAVEMAGRYFHQIFVWC
jgi:hypothetical protein